MRASRTALLLSVLAAASSARSALAQPKPPASAFTAPAPAPPPAPRTGSFTPPVVPRVSSPLPATFEFAPPRAHVASLGPLPKLPVFPRAGASSAGSGLRIGGTIVISLGLATMMGAGIAAIIAGASALDLEDECPGKVCFEGSRGEGRLHRARDAARATDWLLGVGMPVAASGAVMLMYSAVLRRSDSASVPPPVLRAGPGGASLTFHF